MTRKTGFARLLRRFARRDDGAVAIFVALVLPVTLGMAALVEASRVYTVKNQLQITADAAAMASAADAAATASAGQVPSSSAVKSTAIDFAHRNIPIDGQYGDVLVEQDAVMGHWDVETRVFTAGGGPANAVRVVTRGEMPLFFAAALRSVHTAFSDTPTSYIPAAQAIALWRLDTCYQNGFVAGGTIEINSSNTFGEGFCAYGRSGVTMNSSNIFEAGSGVGMADLADLNAGDNNPGHEDALFQRDIAAPAPGAAMQLIDDLIAGTGPSPDYITTTQTVSQMPASLVPGTMYIYTGTDSIELKNNVQNIGVISDYPIKIKSNSILRNVALASRQSVDINSNVVIGDADFCDTGLGASLIIAGGAVSDKDVPVGTNSNIFLHGVQVVSDGDIDMNSNLTITSASVQATGNISINSSSDMSACPDDTSANVTGGATMVAQLVD